MKQIRYIASCLMLSLAANLFAGSIVIKNGETDVTNGEFVMTQVDKIGDPASAATLTVAQTDMNTISLLQSGSEKITAVLSGSNLMLTFLPTDTAGQYVKNLTIKGTDLGGAEQSVTLTVKAVCVWGKLLFHAFPGNIVDDFSSEYGISVDHTSYYGYKNAKMEMYIYGQGEEEEGEKACESEDVRNLVLMAFPDQENSFAVQIQQIMANGDLSEEEKTREVNRINGDVDEVLELFCLNLNLDEDDDDALAVRAQCLPNDRTFAAGRNIGALPNTFGDIYIKLTITNTRNETVSQFFTITPGEPIDINSEETGFDLTSCFDDDGVAVMDSLYLMTNSYCAVYAKGTPDEGTGIVSTYELADSYNPTLTKRILPDVGGKKLYFTGTCQNAKVGEANVMSSDVIEINGLTETYTNLDGAFTLIGGGASSSQAVDIYIENLKLGTQARNGGLCNNGLNFFYEDMPGGSSPFAILSKSYGSGNFFTTNFHIKGENKLNSQPGVNFYLDFINLAKVLSDGFTFGSAPIAVRGSAKLTESLNVASLRKYNTRLNFDDYWIDGNATNGLLELDNSGQTNVGSIDLGNDLNICNFYGGRYKLSSAATRRNSVVTLDTEHLTVDGFAVDYFLSNSMAINYRKFEITLSVRGLMAVPICMYGFGNDAVGYGQVNIFGGTFETYGVSDNYMSETNRKYDYCYFRDKYDMRIPDGSQVNGGGFNNCNVYLCDTVSSRGLNPINAMGDTVCLMSIVPTGTNEDGSAIFTIPDYFKYDIEGMGTISYDNAYGFDGIMGGPAVNSGPKHGINTDASGKVNVYVPCKMDEALEPAVPIKTKNWWTAIMPKYSANPAGGATIKNDGSLYNSYFVDVVLDSMLYERGNRLIATAFESYRGNLYNSTNSQIQRRLFCVMPVETNRWFNFMAPFDISNVYEVNTIQTPELTLGKEAWNQLSESEKQSEWTSYKRNLQENNFNLIIGFAPNLILPGGTTMELKELVQLVGDSLYDAGKLTAPVTINKLTPYFGNNADDAHFYLYQPVDSNTNTIGQWRTKGGSEFEYTWQYVTPVNKTFADENGDNTIDENTSNADVIMEAKHVYGLDFPGDQDYPYWNNRYLIFEGYGMQTVYGSNEQANFVTSASSGLGQWGGNYTFTNYPIQDNMYVLDNRKESKQTNAEIFNSIDWSTTRWTSIEYHGDTLFAKGYEINANGEAMCYDRSGNKVPCDETNTDTVLINIDNSSSTYGKYINVEDVETNLLIDGMDYVSSDEDGNYIDQKYIQPHAAYMIVNRPAAMPNRYTGMTDSEDATGLAPTIGDVSFVVTEFDGHTLLQSNVAQTLNVYDMLGKLVYTHDMAAGENVQIKLASGMYVISGNTDNVKITIK